MLTGNETILAVRLKRSFNNQDYITAATFGTNSTEYFYTDQNEAADLYYRLEITTQNGKRYYSTTLHLRNKNSNRMAVYPNPVKNELMLDISLLKPQPVTLLLRSADGKWIQRYQLLITQPSRQVKLPVAALRPGIYFLQLYTGEEQWVKKIIKQ